MYTSTSGSVPDTDPSTPPDTLVSEKDGLAYWDSVPSTVNGMLGGYDYISKVDLRSSLNFIAKLRSESPSLTSSNHVLLPRAVDCGAGIGRVTAGVLSRVANKIDLVEPVAKFSSCAAQLRTTRAEEMSGPGVVDTIYTISLQTWTPAPDTKYNLIWFQWCLGHLNSEQAISCLERCRNGLAEGGWIVVKENLSTDRQGRDVFDKLDSAVTRAEESWKVLFREAGLRIIRTELCKGFPREILPVRIFALRPVTGLQMENM
jgi:protein N-terminal methyltransferase